MFDITFTTPLDLYSFGHWTSTSSVSDIFVFFLSLLLHHVRCYSTFSHVISKIGVDNNQPIIATWWHLCLYIRVTNNLTVLTLTLRWNVTLSTLTNFLATSAPTPLYTTSFEPNNNYKHLWTTSPTTQDLTTPSIYNNIEHNRRLHLHLHLPMTSTQPSTQLPHWASWRLML